MQDKTTNPPNSKRPTSPARASASRANGRKARGAVSPMGKYNSSLNAIRHGIFSKYIVIPGELAPRFQQLFNDFHDQFRPRTPAERALAEEMVISWWRKQRVWAMESAHLTVEIETRAQMQMTSPSDSAASSASRAVAAITGRERTLDLFLRYETRYERQFHRALIRLRELKAAPPDFELDPDAAPDAPVSPSSPDPAPRPSRRAPTKRTKRDIEPEHPTENKAPASQVPAPPERIPEPPAAPPADAAPATPANPRPNAKVISMFSRFAPAFLLVALCVPVLAQLPRTADGKPNLQGIWQARTRAAYDLADHPSSPGILPGRSVIAVPNDASGVIPYLPAAAAKKLDNFAHRATADPLAQCFMPGTPRIMLMEYPFQIFQTADTVAMTFEWSQVFRLIPTTGKPPLHEGVDTWMGDSRGRWDGDTLVVTVTKFNDKTWFDLVGDFHSDALTVTERYTLTDADTIRYEATINDPKTFSQPWKLTVPLIRQKGIDRLLEYQCQADSEEASGAFERDNRTWYPAPYSKPAPNPDVSAKLSAPGPVPAVKTGANLRRTRDGKPDLTGYFQPNGGGANYGLEKHTSDFLTPGGRGVVIDPADGKLPYRPWARAERIDRELPQRGYDDPTAHCFVAGIPRSMYTPSPYQILQPPGYLVLLFERMSWRVIPIIADASARPHLPDSIRLWQGDSIGHWEGDVLVVDTANLNGKTWLNEVGDVVSHTEHVAERFIPTADGKITYRATVTDPIVYTKPYTIEIPLSRDAEELLEVACHEDNGDLQHLKDVRDEFRAKQKK